MRMREKDERGGNEWVTFLWASCCLDAGYVRSTANFTDSQTSKNVTSNGRSKELSFQLI